MLSKGFTSWNFEEEIAAGKMSLHDILAVAGTLGCETIEWMGYHLPVWDQKAMQDLRQDTLRRGLQTSVIDCKNMRFGGKWWERRQDVDLIKLYAQAAHELACPNVLLFLGLFPDADAHLSQLNDDIANIREVLNFSSPLGVHVVIENHRVYLRTEQLADEGEASDILKICQTIGFDLCRPAPDNDNFYRPSFSKCSPEQQDLSYQHFAELLPWAGHLHVKLKGFDNDGKHLEADYDRLIDLIRTSGYQGALSFEFMKPVQSEKTSVIKQALQYFSERGL